MLVANPDMVTADMVEEVLKFKRLDGALAALRTIADANFAGGKQRDLAARAARRAAACRCSVVWGEADRVLPASQADGLPAAIAVTRIAGAGHIPHMEKSAEVNAIIAG